MISLDVQSSRSVPLSKCFTAIPIGGYGLAVAGAGSRAASRKQGRDRIATPS